MADPKPQQVFATVAGARVLVGALVPRPDGAVRAVTAGGAWAHFASKKAGADWLTSRAE